MLTLGQIFFLGLDLVSVLASLMGAGAGIRMAGGLAWGTSGGKEHPLGGHGL